jgi:uncharacterized protein with von Willebrand factor type A (vWA) domain
MEVLRTYGGDWRAIFVGDASMSPYELLYPGGANEHMNSESGEVWLRRVAEHWPRHLWINPLPERYWQHTASVDMIRQLFGGDRMVAMTLEGLTEGMRALSR